MFILCFIFIVSGALDSNVKHTAFENCTLLDLSSHKSFVVFKFYFKSSKSVKSALPIAVTINLFFLPQSKKLSSNGLGCKLFQFFVGTFLFYQSPYLLVSKYVLLSRNNIQFLEIFRLMQDRSKEP